jgi:hypothetical protein
VRVRGPATQICRRADCYYSKQNHKFVAEACAPTVYARLHNSRMAAVIAAQAQPAATFATSSSPESSYHRRSSSLALQTVAKIEEHHHHSDREHHSYRPAKNLEAFNSLLPPAVEFVEGSSTGALAVAEGKYEPINVTPKATRVNGNAGEVSDLKYSFHHCPSRFISSPCANFANRQVASLKLRRRQVQRRPSLAVANHTTKNRSHCLTANSTTNGLLT